MLEKNAKENFKFELGSRAKDKITGFEGIIIYRTQWINNCNVYGLKPTKLRDDKPIDSCQFDEPQIEIIEKEVIEPKRKTGGPTQSMSQTNR